MKMISDMSINGCLPRPTTDKERRHVQGMVQLLRKLAGNCVKLTASIGGITATAANASLPSENALISRGKCVGENPYHDVK